MQTRLKVADNSGARSLMCIKVLGGAGRRFATLGDVIVVSVKEAIPRSKVVPGTVMRAVIVRVAKPFKRSDGTTICFSDNAAVLLKKDNEPLGTRVFGSIAGAELRKGFQKITSLAEEAY